ncbi:MAG: Gfo/Idh/MocA family oxidoreductase [Candidatus Omnitrophota bacterium]
MNKLKLAIVGCGAVTDCSYVPVLKQHPDVEVRVVADRNQEAADKIGDLLGVGSREDDFKKIKDDVDAVIIALPNKLHKEASSFFLAKGIHVLCEKPMANTVNDCDEIIAAAEKGKAKVMIGHVRRYYQTSKLVKEIISNNWLGRIKSFLFKEGGVFGWSSVSQFYFNKEHAGGGVLIDKGAHVLDLILWWLGDYERVDYYDDSFGGVEANCELRLKMHSGAEGLVKMSRLIPMEKMIRITGERGSLEFTPTDFNSLKLSLGKVQAINIDASSGDNNNLNYYFRQQIDDFISYIKNNQQPLITAKEARRCVLLIEDCYKNAQKIDMPWARRS